MILAPDLSPYLHEKSQQTQLISHIFLLWTAQPQRDGGFHMYVKGTVVSSRWAMSEPMSRRIFDEKGSRYSANNWNCNNFAQKMFFYLHAEHYHSFLCRLSLDFISILFKLLLNPLPWIEFADMSIRYNHNPAVWMYNAFDCLFSLTLSLTYCETDCTTWKLTFPSFHNIWTKHTYIHMYASA